MLEPNERFDCSKEPMDPDSLFNLTEENVPVSVEITSDEPTILYETRTLGTTLKSFSLCSEDHSGNGSKGSNREIV